MPKLKFTRGVSMKWVAPHLTGGLGNRLFQFHAAYGVSKKWNRDCVFFLPMCGKNDHDPIETIFDLYPMIPIIETESEWQVIPEKSGQCFIFDEFGDDPEAKSVVIGGWRQTPLYFKDDSCPVPNWSRFLSDARMVELKAKYELGEKCWMLHVRLGDYKQLPHHQIPVLNYYERCLNEVPKDSKILLFSDEPELCREWIYKIVRSRGLDFQVCDEMDEVTPLWMMSECLGGGITANSTFSWWGAYFAKQKAKQKQKNTYRAYYPDVWGKGLPPARDVVPEWGIRMPIEL